MEHEQITEKIIGCAYTVYNTLGYGFWESIYESALFLELEEVGLNVQRQKSIDVYYKEKKIGHFKTDLIVDDIVVVELKSVEAIRKEFQVQLVNYPVATKMPVGLLINFGPDGVEVKRKVRFLPKS